MMRLEPDQWVAHRIRMSDIACKCPDPNCTHKTIDDTIHPRTMLFFRSVGELIRGLDIDFSVSSGLRCPAWNAIQDGTKDSAHVHRVAVDIAPLGPWMDLAIEAEKAGFFSAILVYPDAGHPFVHLDIHPNDRVVRGYVSGKTSRTLAYGLRWGSPLATIFQWNLDETTDKPDYIKGTLQPECPK
jgi:hypothetical protein